MNADRHDDMQLEALKIFCDVVRWASFSRGAAENGISQSSASQAVHQLEVRLGVKLIDRSKRPLVLTPQGKVYYEGCKDLVGRYLEVENRVKALEDEHNVVGTVRVASIYSVGLHHMSQYVRTFGELYPGASVRLEYLHPTRVVESVLRRGGGAGADLVPAQVARPDGDPLARGGDGPGGPPVAPVRRRWRASRSRELDGEKFVGFDADLSIRRAIDRFLRHHDVHVDGRARVRQHREHQAGRRDPGRGGDPARADRWRGRSRPARWSRSGSTARTRAPADAAAGDHPPAAATSSA